MSSTTSLSDGRRLRQWPSLLTLLIAAFFVGLPLGFLLYASFLTDAPGAASAQLTWANWEEILGNDPVAIFNTLKIALYVTIVSVCIASLLAWLVARTDMPFRSQINQLLVLPMLLSPLLTTLSWVLLLNPRAGLINVTFVNWFHIGRFLFNINSLAGIVAVMVLYFVPFAYLILVSVLHNIDAGFEDASRLSGAGVFTTLRRITLPIVSPAILSSALLIFALATEQLSVPTLIGVQAHIPTLQYQIYIAMIESPVRPNIAATAGCLLLIPTLAGLLIADRLMGAGRRYVTVSGKASRAKLVRLGRAGRAGAFFFGAFYIFLAVVLPYGALILGSLMKYLTPRLTLDVFTLQNFRNLFSDPGFRMVGSNTLLFAAIGASITLLAGVWISRLTVRNRGLSGRALEVVAMLPLSVPGISLGLGILWAYLFFPIGIYGTLWILLLAYATRLSPQGVRGVSAGLVQIDADLEHAARIHGAASNRAFVDITLPLLRSALFATWTLVFVQIILEFSMTVMLYSSRTTTAAINIWFAYFGGDFGRAYSEAVIMATLSFVIIIIGQRLFGFLRQIAA